LLVGADPGRVAAAEQLQSLGKQLNIPVVAEVGAIKPDQIAQKGLDEEIEESDAKALKSLYKLLQPTEVMLVADAMTGQEAVNAAEQFHAAIELTGLILTKMDGDARGGAALSIRSVTGIPIKFVGSGEKADALDPFYPDRFASRILGMGDMLTLIEKAKEEITEEEAESLTARMKKGDLTLDDFLAQYQRIKRMGPIGNLLGMLPGLGQIKKQLNVDEMDENFFKHTEAIIMSMTKAERANPDIIDGSRRRRIATGSGTQAADINRLIKQFKEAKKIMQAISTGRGPKITQLLR
jgi:signal recognition particle subunit SRP54